LPGAYHVFVPSIRLSFSSQYLLSQRKVHVVADVFLAFYFMISLGALEGTAWIFFYQATV
jgi:hypothetical protein